MQASMPLPPRPSRRRVGQAVPHSRAAAACAAIVFLAALPAGAARAARPAASAAPPNIPPATQAGAREGSADLETALKAHDYAGVASIMKRLLAGDPKRAARASAAVLARPELGPQRTHVLLALAYHRPKPRAAEPTLVKLLDDPNGPVRAWTAICLGQIGTAASIRPLERRLRAETFEQARYRIRVALGKLGRPYVGYFIAGLSDRDKDRRYWSMVALGEIGDVRAVPALCRLLDAEGFWDRHFAAEKIEKLTGIKRSVPTGARTMPDGSVRGTSRARPAAEIKRTVEQWMARHADELARPIAPPPERWVYTPLPPLYADAARKLRKGMTPEQVRKVLGDDVPGRDTELVWHYRPDRAARRLTVHFALADGRRRLKDWRLHEFPEATRQAVGRLKALERLSLHLEEHAARFQEGKKRVAVRELLWLDTSFHAVAKAPKPGVRITREQAGRLVETLAVEGFFERAATGRRTYEGGTYVLRVGPYHAAIGPGPEMVLLLRRLEGLLDGPAGSAVTGLLKRLGAAAGGAPATTRPATQPSSPRLIRRPEDIALTDADLKAIGLERAAGAPEPNWARPFHKGWFGWHSGAKARIVALREVGSGEVAHYGVIVYPNRWLAEAAVDAYRGLSTMWLPITAWPGTGDRCWGLCIAKENVVLYAGRLGRERARAVASALVRRIDRVLRTPEAALARRQVDAKRWLKIAGDQRRREANPKLTGEVRRFLAGRPDTPWRWEALNWLWRCGAQTAGKPRALAAAAIDACLRRPQGHLAVEALLTVKGLALARPEADFTRLAVLYARARPARWRQFARAMRQQHPRRRGLHDALAAAEEAIRADKAAREREAPAR